MHCQFCSAKNTKVIDSRLVGGGNQIRRRRECFICKERFTTYETAELVMPYVIKANNSRVPFDTLKLRQGLDKALEKRPITTEVLEKTISMIIRKIRALGERDISSKVIGRFIMEELRTLDLVAYVRFASVYLEFNDVEAFQKEIAALKKRL